MIQTQLKKSIVLSSLFIVFKAWTHFQYFKKFQDFIRFLEIEKLLVYLSFTVIYLKVKVCPVGTFET